MNRFAVLHGGGKCLLKSLRAAAAVALCAMLVASPASAQSVQSVAGSLGFAGESGLKTEPGAKMLLESDQLVYDYDKSTVSAVGAVKIYYDGYTLEAQKVSYDQKNKKMIAEGGVKIVDKTGTVVTADTKIGRAHV